MHFSNNQYILNTKYLVQESRDGSRIGPISLLLSVSHSQKLCFLPPKLRHCLIRDLFPGNIPFVRGHSRGSIKVEASNYFGHFKLNMLVVGWQAKRGTIVLVR